MTEVFDEEYYQGEDADFDGHEEEEWGEGWEGGGGGGGGGSFETEVRDCP